MKRRIIKSIILLACLAVFASCGQAKDGDKKTSDKKTEESKTTDTPGKVEEDSLARTGTMRDISSMELVKDMGVGWNLGDTLDVCEADRDGDGKVNETAPEGQKVDETLWGNPKATKELFDALKEDGVQSVRIPITWRDHLGDAPDYTVDSEWMDRVQEVVNYAYDLGMYVIINVHHDGGGDPAQGAWIRNASHSHDEVMEKYKKLWAQIADRFKDYSDYLVFESMNEVGFDDMQMNQAYDLLLEFNQEFVDLIRGSGGNNASRYLLIAGYWTDVERCCNGMFQMPKDVVTHSILSVHYYTPWTFCTTDSASQWGSEYEVEEMKGKVELLKTTYVDKGTPVIIGEYGVGPNELNSCIFFCEMFVKLCTDAGIPAFFWDNGEFVDRNTYEWRDKGIIDGILRGASGKEYTPEKIEISATQITDVRSEETGTLTVSWESNAGVEEYEIAGYEVVIGTDPGCIREKRAQNVDVSENRCTFTDLPSGTEYYAHFRAYTTGNKPIHGDWSKAVSIKIQ